MSASVLQAGCAKPTPHDAREVSYGEDDGKKRKVNEAELAQELQRFSSRFIDRMTQASEALAKTQDTETQELIARKTLLYASSALSIATDASPAIGLLDMITFVALCRNALETRLIPEYYGEDARPLLQVFRSAEEETWVIGGKVLSVENQNRLAKLIKDWIRANPDQTRVEFLRLGDFSIVAGAEEKAKAEETSGLLSSVASAVSSADEALLLGERGLYLLQRMPFLLRLQARLGSREIIDDITDEFDKLNRAGPIISQSRMLAQEAGFVAKEAKDLVLALHPLILPKKGLLPQYLASTERIVEKTHSILLDLKTLAPAGDPTLAVDRLLQKIVLYLLALTLGVVAIWWSGYYLYRRAYLRAYLKASSLNPSAARDGHQESDHRRAS